MSGYEVLGCKCGKLHFVDAEKFFNTQRKGAKYILVCIGGGGVNVYSMEKGIYDGEVQYQMMATELHENIYSVSDLKENDVIDVQEGYKVFMKNGEYANYASDLGNSYFQDLSMRNNEYEIDDDYYKNRSVVDLDKTIKSLPDKYKDIASNYLKIRCNGYKGW
jgi:hypothetical protein